MWLLLKGFSTIVLPSGPVGRSQNDAPCKSCNYGRWSTYHIASSASWKGGCTASERDGVNAGWECLWRRSRCGRGRGGSFLTEHRLQPLDDEVFDGSPASGRRNFRSLQDAIGQINGRLHMAINTVIWANCQSLNGKVCTIDKLLS